jgi:cell division protein FtsA
MCEATRRILGGQTRAGRPIGVEGLPESAFTPAFAAVAGLLVYPQVASREYFEPRRQRRVATGTEGYVTRVSRWLRDSF